MRPLDREDKHKSSPRPYLWCGGVGLVGFHIPSPCGVEVVGLIGYPSPLWCEGVGIHWVPHPLSSCGVKAVGVYWVPLPLWRSGVEFHWVAPLPVAMWRWLGLLDSPSPPPNGVKLWGWVPPSPNVMWKWWSSLDLPSPPSLWCGGGGVHGMSLSPLWCGGGGIHWIPPPLHNCGGGDGGALGPSPHPCDVEVVGFVGSTLPIPSLL